MINRHDNASELQAFWHDAGPVPMRKPENLQHISISLRYNARESFLLHDGSVIAASLQSEKARETRDADTSKQDYTRTMRAGPSRRLRCLLLPGRCARRSPLRHG